MKAHTLKLGPWRFVWAFGRGLYQPPTPEQREREQVLYGEPMRGKSMMVLDSLAFAANSKPPPPTRRPLCACLWLQSKVKPWHVHASTCPYPLAASTAELPRGPVLCPTCQHVGDTFEACPIHSSGQWYERSPKATRRGESAPTAKGE